MPNVSVVKFYEDELQVIDEGGDRQWVALRPGCDALGLDVSGQMQKLKRTPWARVGLISTHDASGREQEMFCLHFKTVPMWLATIDSSRVNEDLRVKLERYQREAADVLAKYFIREPGIASYVSATLTEVERAANIMERLGLLDARVKFVLGDRTMNAVNALPGTSGSAPALPPADEPKSIVRWASELGYGEIAGPLASKVGKLVAAAYRERHDGNDPEKIRQLIGGRDSPVSAYREVDRDLVVAALASLVSPTA